MSSLFLHNLSLPDSDSEDSFFINYRRVFYQGVYPFRIFPEKELKEIEFAPITIFYGGNGSGKTTLLNIIAEKANMTRYSPFNSSALFSDYLTKCHLSHCGIPRHSQMLTSDDVTDYLLHVRKLNNGIDDRSEELVQEYTSRKHKDLRFKSLADYDEWKETYDAQTKSKTRFVKARLMKNVDMVSNGETALKIYTERITENALYLIDEPETSLSAQRQQDLAQFLFDSARFYNCQIVIATHSPFFLAIPGAKIYDLDRTPAEVVPWTELANVRVYYNFFQEHAHEFE